MPLLQLDPGHVGQQIPTSGRFQNYMRLCFTLQLSYRETDTHTLLCYDRYHTSISSQLAQHNGVSAKTVIVCTSPSVQDTARQHKLTSSCTCYSITQPLAYLQRMINELSCLAQLAARFVQPIIQHKAIHVGQSLCRRTKTLISMKRWLLYIISSSLYSIHNFCAIYCQIYIKQTIFCVFIFVVSPERCCVFNALGGAGEVSCCSSGTRAIV